MKTKKILAVLVLGMLSACSSIEKADQTSSFSDLPNWVTQPSIEGGFVDTQCVRNNADMNILKTKASALARAEIAKQIELQVKAMDKTYSSLTFANQASAEGDTFESVSKQITNQKLVGTRPVRVDYVPFPDGTAKLCSMVTMEPAKIDALFDQVIRQSGRAVSAESREVLYQEFKAQKAQQELETELKH
mgnify:CR=1 FL=1